MMNVSEDGFGPSPSTSNLGKAKTDVALSTKMMLPGRRRYLLENDTTLLPYNSLSIQSPSIEDFQALNRSNCRTHQEAPPTVLKINSFVSSGMLRNGLCPLSISTTSTASCPPFLPSLDLQTSIASRW